MVAVHPVRRLMEAEGGRVTSIGRVLLASRLPSRRSPDPSPTAARGPVASCGVGGSGGFGGGGGGGYDTGGGGGGAPGGGSGYGGAIRM